MLKEEIDIPYLPNTRFTEACIDYLPTLRRCTVPLEIPLSIAGECYSLVSQEVNYVACVRKHKDDEDFYRTDWRLFLNRSSELWRSRREVIELRDHGGKLVDSITY